MEKSKRTKVEYTVGGVCLVLLNILMAKSSWSFQTLWKLLVLDAVLLGLLFAAKKIDSHLSEKWKKVLNVVLWFLTVLFSSVAMQGIISRCFQVKNQYLAWNLLIGLVVLCVCTLFFRRVKTACILYTCLMTALALTDYYVTAFRGQPLMLSDFLSVWTAATVAGTYHFDVPLSLGIILAGIWEFLMIQVLFQRGEFPKNKKVKILRIGTGVTALGVIAVLAGNLKKVVPFEAVNLWETQNDYREKGLMYTLLAESQYMTVEKPEGYSKEEVKEILSNVKEADVSEDTAPENLIVIMNESWADLDVINTVKTDCEMTPYLKSLQDETSNGWLYVPVFGAGTAETEYEVLSGNCKNFLPTGSVAYRFYVHDPEYGMVYALKEQGYETVAMHPYAASNWNRNTAYEKLGFDSFISLENWQEELVPLRYFASDESTYKEVERVVDEKEEGQKLFVFCVTLQNHGGYDESTAGSFQNTVSLEYDTEYPEAEAYLSEINETDKAFRSLVKHYENAKERTMIVMFGDHQPAVEEGFYEELFGKAKSEYGVEDLQKRYITPYIIWTNYECEQTQEDMSANYLGSYILEKAGLQMTSYEREALQLKETVPVIGQGAVRDSMGDWYSILELPESYQEALDEYEKLQYSYLFDQAEEFSLLD